jgi:predicted nucleotidyltransferase
MPNNILGIEYAKALLHLKSSIKINTLKRISANYNDTELKLDISSATAIRLALKDISKTTNIQSSVPPDVFNTFSNLNISDLIDSNDFSNAILPIIRRMNVEELKLIHDVSEGLENKILYEANNNENIVDLIEALKSKRYTRTRIQRILFKILLNINSSYMGFSYELKPLYIRVLAFNDRGREILKELRESSKLPVITNLDRLDSYETNVANMLKYDVRATNLYSTFSNVELNSDFRKRPIYIK